MSSPSEHEIDNLEADIVILGSGGGLVAAVAAAEKGIKNILVLEKQGHIGGHTKMAQGFFACESPVQQREQVFIDKDDCFNTYMAWDHWARMDPRIIRAYVNKSGDTVRWFQQKGVEFNLKMHSLNQRRVLHWPLKGKGPNYGRGAELIKILIRESYQYGVKIILNTRGKRIMRDLEGGVTGVVVLKGGKEYEIRTNCIIIATGNFCGNKKLLRKLCPNYYDGMHIWEKTEYHTGDGLTMAVEVGAAIADSIYVSHMGPHPDYGSKPGNMAASMKESISGIVFEPNTIWINRLGRRFINEACRVRGGNAGHAIFMQPGRVMYTFFDDQMRQDMEEKGLLMGRGWGKQENAQRMGLPGLKELLYKRTVESEDSLVKIADSLDGIAKCIGADPKVLKSEVEEYNSFCERRYDEIFAKEARYLKPFLRPPYYAIRCITSCSGTMGGIKVNEHMQVLDTKYNVIPGLFVAGTIADGWQGVDYCGELPGTSLGFAINSGRIAGENATEFILSNKD